MGTLKTICVIGIHDVHFHKYVLTYVACVGQLQIILWSI